MYRVSGSNVQGQWFCASRDHHALIDFPTVNTSTITGIVSESSLVRQEKITSINWAYNLFLVHNDFYLVGAWAAMERAVIKVELPEKSLQVKDLIFVGNDRTLFLCNVKTEDLWTLDLPENEESARKWNWCYKKLNLISQSEKNIIIKIVVSNSDYPYILTSSGTIYEYPVKIDTSQCVGTVCDIECGNEHNILLTNVGRIYTWGNGKRCQLGHGDLMSCMIPTEIDALAGVNIVKISAGGWHSLALSYSGDLYAWGWNDAGQLGVQEEVGDKKRESDKVLPKRGNSCALPTLVDFYDDAGLLLDNAMVKDIACGSRHSAVVLADNTIWTTGLNKYGQLGFCPLQIHSQHFFKKALECDSDCNVLCGPWCTVVKKISEII